MQFLHGKSFVKRHGKQRIDSTHVLAAVARLGRLEVVRETLRLFLETIQRLRLEGSLPEGSLFHDRYIDCDIAWHKVGKDPLISKHQPASVKKASPQPALSPKSRRRKRLPAILKAGTSSSAARKNTVWAPRRNATWTPDMSAMKQRNGIEGTISEFARNGGRRTRYRGLPKTSLCNYLHGAALNVKRLIRLLQYQMSAVAVSV